MPGATLLESLPDEALHARARDAIRHADLDPLRDPEAVRRLVLGVVAEAGAEFGLASDDVGDLATRVHATVVGFGRLQPLFDDPNVEEIWINEPGRVFIARQGVSELTTIVLDQGEVRDLVERMLRLSGRRLDVSNPFVDALLPDGSRLHVAIPDITRRHWAVNIRRFVVRARDLEDLVERETLSAAAAAFLQAAVVSGVNILVAGGTQAGKTTMLGALLGCVPARERLISCEEVFELRIDHPDWVAMQARDASLEGTGAISLGRLVREALRMRPTRLVVGEVRQGEALDLLIAMNSGMPSMATLHANSAREAITKLCTLPLMAGPNIAADFIVPTVAAAVDLVVHLRTNSQGRRSVSEISAVTGRVESGVIDMAQLFVDRGFGLERGRATVHEDSRFGQHGFDLAGLLAAA